MTEITADALGEMKALVERWRAAAGAMPASNLEYIEGLRAAGDALAESALKAKEESGQIVRALRWCEFALRTRTLGPDREAHEQQALDAAQKALSGSAEGAPSHPADGVLQQGSDGARWVQQSLLNSYEERIAKAEEEGARLREALAAHHEWWSKERAGPQYPDGVTRDNGGEAIWRAWWEEQLALCDRAHTLTEAIFSAALSTNGGETE